MNLSTLQELKQELLELQQKQLVELCLNLAKYKKDNKEYLSYLLFQSHDSKGFVEQVKAETDNYFVELKTQKNLYYIKKGLRRILRILNKYCRYIGEKENIIEVQLYFCRKIKQSGIPIHESARIENLFNAQVKKIKSITAALHEDLRADYIRELENILALS